MAKKKFSAEPTAVLNRYLKHVVLKNWRDAGREFVALADKSGVKKSAISKCWTEGEGLGLDSIARIADAVHIRFTKLWEDAHAWAAEHPEEEETSLALPTSLPGWADAAEQVATTYPALAPFVLLAAEVPLPPEYLPASATAAYVRRLARMTRDARIRDEEREAHHQRLQRDSSTMPKGKPR